MGERLPNDEVVSDSEIAGLPDPLFFKTPQNLDANFCVSQKLPYKKYPDSLVVTLCKS